MGRTGKTGISVILNEYDAALIVNGFNKNERYLRDIIYRYVPNARKLVDLMDYRELLHHGYVIKGVAEKIYYSREHIRKRNPKSLEKKLRIKRVEQLTLF